MLMVAVAGAAIAAAGCNAGPAAPTNPAYDTDVRPIFMAHCVRCHGAGGNLNNPTEPTGPNAPTIPSISSPLAQATFASMNIFLDQFDNANGKNGAGTMTTLIKDTLLDSAIPPALMPPAPAPRLTDWESTTVINWTINPICSNSPGTSTICPNGPGKAM